MQELQFTTHYQLTWADAGHTLFTILSQNGLLLLLALAFIPLPGCLTLLLITRRVPHAFLTSWDSATWWGVAYALGACLWPLLWFAFTLFNGRFTAPLLWFLFITGWLLTITLYQQVRPQALPLSRPTPTTLLLLALLILGFSLRLLAVRDLAFPPWVDASRHALITAVMAHNGQTPSTYQPYLPIDRFPYHFGFHTLSASLHLMLGTALPALLLYLGQLLNALVPLTIYTAGKLLTGRSQVGLLAAFFVAVPFFFPAYYATWGRFTQLTAVLILPILLTFTWQLIYNPSSTRPPLVVA